MTKYGMVIDLRKCVGCQSCTVSCKFENNIPKGSFRSWVRVWEKGTYPDVSISYLPRLCNQCDDPSCVEVCPAAATYKIENGIVVIDSEACIGCAYCVQACPYDMRYINPITNVADKCDYCQHRLDDGLLPACITSCIGDARVFGDMDDPNSKISKLIKKENVKVLYPEFGTEPNTFYIELDEEPIILTVLQEEN